MKENIIALLIFIGSIYLTWYIRGEMDKKEFNARILASESRRTITERIDSTPVAPQQAIIENKAPVTREHTIDADSIFNRGVVIGLDSARKAFAYYTVRVDTTVQFDPAGSVRFRYDPLRRMAIIDLTPPPIRTITRIIVDSIFVKTPEEREWWRTPAYIAGAFAIGWVSHDLLKD